LALEADTACFAAGEQRSQTGEQRKKIAGSRRSAFTGNLRASSSVTR